ncbi:MAG TPA: NAD-dependent epimerase/dehydratase family protein [Actinomycetota bacterium]
MRALVTGGAGFIGSSIARELLRRGDQVRIIDNFLTGFAENVPAEAELLEADIRDLDAVRRACRDIDVVFHQAALRSVPKSVDDPLLSQSCNVEGTLHVLMAAADAGARRVVYASSSSVYGDRSEGVNNEDLPTAPLSPYAVSKLAGENYCRVWTSLGRISTVSLRYFNVYGPGQHPESKYSAVFPAFISSLVADVAPELHWDGEQSRDFCYIDDVVAANIAAAEAGDEVDGAVMNIGGGHPKSVNEVLQAVSDAVGRWIDPVRLPRRPGDVRHTRADLTRAGELLAWKPQTEWVESVEQTVGWFLRRNALAAQS